MNALEFDRLVQKYQSLVYTICRQLVADEGYAQDLTQETFLSAWRSMNRCPAGYEKQWLARALLDSHKLVGWLLIAFGALIAYQNLIMNIFGDLVYRWGHSSPVFRALYLVMASLPDVVVCVVLIVCGVWLVKGPHPAKKPDASKDVPEDADFCEYHADEPDNAALLSSPVVNENEVTDDGTEHDE